jgi:hypothetical protein
VKQNDEARFGEGPCEGLDFMLLHTGIAMRHGDCGAPALTCRHVKPAAQLVGRSPRLLPLSDCRP